jgi:CheY-like chemotaxis protein
MRSFAFRGMTSEKRLQARSNASRRADFAVRQDDNQSREGKEAMKLAMTWGANKGTNSCRIKSTLQPGDKSHTLAEGETPPITHHVLVVDDDPNLTRLMATILRTSGIDALTATSGRAALDAVEHNDVEAIVLDVEMPEMDGRGFFRELRARGNKMPVLIASAFGAREAQRELGADAAVEKPFDPEVLVSELERILAA